MKEGQRPGNIVRSLTLFSQINLFLTSTLCSHSREQPIFLQLKDYFWVKTPSAYELPFGTKGSGKLFLSSMEKQRRASELLLYRTKGRGKYMLMGCSTQASVKFML